MSTHDPVTTLTDPQKIALGGKRRVYRTDRRNFARAARTIRDWRFRKRVRSGLYGWRKDAKGIAYRVFTYIVAAS